MTPREFLEQVVRPNINDFSTNYASVRHAYNAVAAVDALAAHIYIWCVHNAPSEVAGLADDSHYRDQLAGRDSDFRVLRDLAKAQKHVRLTGKRSKNAEVKESADMTARTPLWGKLPWGQFPWDGSPLVVVTTSSGKDRSVMHVTTAALTFLEGEMMRLKI